MSKIKKKTKRYIMLALFTAFIIVMVTQYDLQLLIKETFRQAWLFVVLLILKFGEENVWRPIIAGEAMEAHPLTLSHHAPIETSGDVETENEGEAKEEEETV